MGKKQDDSIGKEENCSEVKEGRETVFGKEQLLSSKKYAEQHDILSALLTDTRMYTFSEVDRLVKDYMKGQVK